MPAFEFERRLSPQSETAKMVDFINMNRPDRRFLRKMADTGRSVTFRIGDQKWRLSVTSDTLDPVHFINMSTFNPARDGIDTYTLITDKDIRHAIGVHFSGAKQCSDTFDSPVDLDALRQEILAAERQRVIRSFRQTHSIARTSHLQAIRQDYVRRIRNHHQNHAHA